MPVMTGFLVVICLITAFFMLYNQYLSPEAQMASRARDALNQSYAAADAVDYLVDPSAQRRDREATRACRTYGC